MIELALTVRTPYEFLIKHFFCRVNSMKLTNRVYAQKIKLKIGEL